MVIDEKVWHDQEEFNRQLRSEPCTTVPERLALTKEFMLHLMAECAEFLDACGTWKMHRRPTGIENREHVREELIDILKYWMTVGQVWGFTPEELAEGYWMKSAAVRQKYAEEWLRGLTRPTVLMDLDNVLCDYITGLGRWLIMHHLGTVDGRRVQALMTARGYLNGDALGLPPRVWARLKHEFRTSGAKRTLPVMPGAREFVEWCRVQGWAIVLITSRPIDRYPNLYSDTIWWLKKNQLEFDFVWWGQNKAEKLSDMDLTLDVRRHVLFAVDDDPVYIDQYEKIGVPAYWLTLAAPEPPSPSVTVVRTLEAIIQKETPPCLTTTPDTDPTRIIEGNVQHFPSKPDPSPSKSS